MRVNGGEAEGISEDKGRVGERKRK